MKWLISMFVGSALIGLSCEENLPSYRDPLDVVDVRMEARYAYSNTDNSVHVDFIVMNRFDETLQAKASIEGTGRITLKRDTTRHCAFTVSALNVVNGYNPATGILTIDPGKTIQIRYVWNFIDDNGGDLRTTAFDYYSDDTCISWGRKIALNETFTITGSLKVFEKIPAVTVVPRELSMCHVNIFVLQNYCPIIDPDKPCSP